MPGSHYGSTKNTACISRSSSQDKGGIAFEMNSRRGNQYNAAVSSQPPSECDGLINGNKAAQTGLSLFASPPAQRVVSFADEGAM